jgi:hypothetical protein
MLHGADIEGLLKWSGEDVVIRSLAPAWSVIGYRAA